MGELMTDWPNLVRKFCYLRAWEVTRYGREMWKICTLCTRTVLKECNGTCSTVQGLLQARPWPSSLERSGSATTQALTVGCNVILHCWSRPKVTLSPGKLKITVYQTNIAQYHFSVTFLHFCLWERFNTMCSHFSGMTFHSAYTIVAVSWW